MADELLSLLRDQLGKYPAMQLQDCIKLLYQHFLGSEHLYAEPARCFQRLLQEKEAVGVDMSVPAYEEIGKNICRFNLQPLSAELSDLFTLAHLFLVGIEKISGNAEEGKSKFEESIETLLTLIHEKELPFSYQEACLFIELYRKKGMPAIHHSNCYKDAYHPAYRLLRTDFARYYELFAMLDRLMAQKDHVILAIDGNCGAGKSTLASLLAEVYPCNIIHMDDFYLPKDLRTKERLDEAGGNVHYERFTAQVLPALRALKNNAEGFQSASYQIFDCHTMDYKARTGSITKQPLTIVEGSYCLRKEFRDAYDCMVFLTVSCELQKERLRSRNGEEALNNFITKWIPMEEKYFDTYKPAAVCDLTFSVS